MTAAHDDTAIGATVERYIDEKRARSGRYREVQDRLRPFEEVARVVTFRRAELGSTQQSLAERMDTTTSVRSLAHCLSPLP